MNDYAKVNRQALQLTTAGVLLVAALAYGVLPLLDMLKQFVIAPAVTGLFFGFLNDYRNRSNPPEEKLSAFDAGKVLSRIWLFLPLSIAAYAAVVILATESYAGLRWVGPFFGIPLGFQISNLLHDRYVS